MKFKELLDMYDNWNGTIVVNDYDLNRIVKAKTSDIGYNKTDVDYSYLYNEDVVSFGFYDNEFCVRLYYESDKKSNYYEVGFTVVGHTSIEVYAESVEAAIEMASEEAGRLFFGELENYEVEAESVYNCIEQKTVWEI